MIALRALWFAMLLVFSTFMMDANAAPRGGVPHNFGLGVVFGEPTGLSAKAWMSRQAAFDAGLAFSFSDFFLGYVDYLHHFGGLSGQGLPRFFQELRPYVGVGGELFVSTTDRRSSKKFFADSTSSSVGLGVRVPLGIDWVPAGVPIDVFAEIVPGVGIVPSTFGFFQGGIGIRYYFN